MELIFVPCFNRICEFDSPPAYVFAWLVLKLDEQGPEEWKLLQLLYILSLKISKQEINAKVMDKHRFLIHPYNLLRSLGWGETRLLYKRMAWPIQEGQRADGLLA